LIERPLPDIDPGQVISFKDDIQPIFTTNCVRCHDGDRDPDLSIGNSYNSLLAGYVTANDPDNSLLYTTLVDGHQNLDVNSIALIKAWIDRGAENN